jgi:hypothetical protein
MIYSDKSFIIDHALILFMFIAFEGFTRRGVD